MLLIREQRERELKQNAHVYIHVTFMALMILQRILKRTIVHVQKGESATVSFRNNTHRKQQRTVRTRNDIYRGVSQTPLQGPVQIVLKHAVALLKQYNYDINNHIQ